MKKMLLLGCLILFFAPTVFAQDKIEAPIWNVGDKWTFTGNGTIKVGKAEQGGYVLKFSDKKCIFESQGCGTILKFIVIRIIP